MQKPKVVVGVFILSCLLAVTLAKTEESGTPSNEPATIVSSSEPVYPAMAVGSGTVVLGVSVDASQIPRLQKSTRAMRHTGSATRAVRVDTDFSEV